MCCKVQIVEDFHRRRCAAAAASSTATAALPLPPPLHFAVRLLRFEARATPPGDITCLPTRPLNRGGQHDAF